MSGEVRTKEAAEWSAQDSELVQTSVVPWAVSCSTSSVVSPVRALGAGQSPVSICMFECVSLPSSFVVNLEQ